MAHKTQVEFKSHFSGKKVRLMGQEIRYKWIGLPLFCSYVEFGQT